MLHTFGLKHQTDKATYHNFTEFYDMVLGQRRYSIKTMIEYGIAGGASLRMWRDYFPTTTRIIAFDINLSGNPTLPNVDCFYANQDLSNSLEKGITDANISTVDLIVEDGGHRSTQQRNSLRASWPHLAPGGIYIIEDLHTNIRHWYPRNPDYYNESPTMFEDIHNASLGLPNNMPIPCSEIKQFAFFIQPNTTSMTCVLFKTGTYPLQFASTTETTETLISHIETNQPNIYLRFGDGDFNLMSGTHDMLAAPSKEIQEAYTRTLSHLSPNSLIAVNYHCTELGTSEPLMRPGVHTCPIQISKSNIDKICAKIPSIHKLYSAVALHHTLVLSIPLYTRFLKAIRTNASTIILCDNRFSSDTLTTFFGPHTKIGGPASNSFNERERITEEFSRALETADEYTVCILALGCGGRAMSHRFIDAIHAQNKKVLLLDIGSSIDLLMGHNTRAWIELTQPNVSGLLDAIHAQ